ncbi:sensor histidine kinase [Frankia sp. AgKG'84/4]|uniref:sensor histidine kinase n=1 Tax=Frankia sp. AgKG'84/4 TaxID=573490 RepID=UPI00200ECFA7|nr:HAMP domain-containing sensor histidine kinase [Frankia sp. AgKG'84/4]MCL9795147.1 HAMP domain-containing histidine kinase [Frankia sp. AgKG'84/4]
MSTVSPSTPERARRRHGSARPGRAPRRGSRSRSLASVSPLSWGAARGRGGASTGPLRRLATRLPQGRGLPLEDWTARHTLMSLVLAMHLPIIVLFAVLRGLSPEHGFLAASPPALLFAAAVVPGRRRVRALAASLGLLCCSVVLVHISNGLTPMYFHFFVVVALIALYEEWTVYLLAIAFVFVANLVMGDIIATHVPSMGNAWLLAGLHAGFIFALACAQMVFWHYNEQSRRRVEEYRQQLYEGQQSLMARLEETDRIRSDLVATVSHEFRTPLTGIRGNLLTIKRRRNRLSDAQLDDLLDAAVNNSDRLSRLLENMLTAATATGADETTIADLPEVVRHVLASLPYTSSPSSVTVDLPAELPVRMARQALIQVVANLVDNALVHSWPGAPVRLIAGRVGDEVVLRVRNPGPDLDPATIHQLFEPFTQRDGTATRQTDGAGMGLYVVRRLVEVHGGRLRMSSDNGEIIVEVDLWAATASNSPAPDSPQAEPDLPVPMPLPRSLRLEEEAPPRLTSGPLGRQLRRDDIRSLPMDNFG